MKRLFRSGPDEFQPLGYRLPFWRCMSFTGWLLLLLGTLTGALFVAGLWFGEVMFIPPVKSKSGAVVTASYASSPAWYVTLIALNAVLSVGIWALFVAWLRGRK